MIEKCETETRTNAAARKIWRAHVEAWRKSGLSRAEYCRRCNISPHALRYWQKKDEKFSRTGMTFVSIPLTRAVTTSIQQKSNSSLKVEIGSRFKIEVADEFSPTTLSRLVATLEGC